MNVEIYCYDPIEVLEWSGELNSWSSLWWDDLEEAGIASVWLAFEEDQIVGFQSINGDGRCVAIEVRSGFQGKGIASLMVEASGCVQPERNECPEFWAKFE